MKSLKFTFSLVTILMMGTSLIAQDNKNEDAVAPINCDCPTAPNFKLLSGACNWVAINGSWEVCQGSCTYSYSHGGVGTIDCPTGLRAIEKKNDKVGKTEINDPIPSEYLKSSRINSENIITEAYPTPATNEVNFGMYLVGKNMNDFSYQIFNSLGQEMKLGIQEAKVPAGNFDLTIPVNELKSGYYFINFTINGESSTQKFIVSGK